MCCLASERGLIRDTPAADDSDDDDEDDDDAWLSLCMGPPSAKRAVRDWAAGVDEDRDVIFGLPLSVSKLDSEGWLATKPVRTASPWLPFELSADGPSFPSSAAFLCQKDRAEGCREVGDDMEEDEEDDEDWLRSDERFDKDAAAEAGVDVDVDVEGVG